MTAAPTSFGAICAAGIQAYITMELVSRENPDRQEKAMQNSGTIFEIRRFAIHDGPGIRTTVFLKGCPLDCWWCHNPEGRCPSVETFDLRSAAGNSPGSENRAQATVGSVVTAEAVIGEIMKDETFYDQSGGGVTFSGGEPMAQIEFLDSLLEACRDHGLHTAVDTCGYAPFSDFERIYDRVNLLLFDLKLMDPSAHREYTGVSNELILSNLARLAHLGDKLAVRIPLVPGITDTRENLEAIVAFLGQVNSIRRISLLPYNKLGEDKVDRYRLPRRRLQLEPQSTADVEQRAAWFRDRGYDVTIGG